jgi:hypothetical protein
MDHTTHDARLAISTFRYAAAAKTSCGMQHGSYILNKSVPAHLLQAALVGVLLLLLLLLLKSLLPFAAQPERHS